MAGDFFGSWSELVCYVCSFVHDSRTLPAEQRDREPLGLALLRYGQLLANRRILGYSAGGFLYAGMFAYIAGTPLSISTITMVDAQEEGVR